VVRRSSRSSKARRLLQGVQQVMLTWVMQSMNTMLLVLLAGERMRSKRVGRSRRTKGRRLLQIRSRKLLLRKRKVHRGRVGMCRAMLLHKQRSSTPSPRLNMRGRRSS
jgi:hypothetical protein